jgi:hypothetical protein
MHPSHLKWSRHVPNLSLGLGETPETLLSGLKQNGGFQPTPFMWLEGTDGTGLGLEKLYVAGWGNKRDGISRLTNHLEYIY